MLEDKILPILVLLALAKCSVNICKFGLIWMRYNDSFRWCSMTELMISLVWIRPKEHVIVSEAGAKWQSLFKDVRMLKVGMMFIASKLVKCGPLVSGSFTTGCLLLFYVQKLLADLFPTGHELKYKIIRQILSLQWKPHEATTHLWKQLCANCAFPSLILFASIWAHPEEGDHHHSFHLWEVLSLRQGPLTKWSCLSRAFSLLTASKGHTNSHQLPLPQDSSSEIRYYSYQGHIHSSFEHPPHRAWFPVPSQPG